MADEADIAFDFEQRYLAHAMASQRKTAPRLSATGVCHNCGIDHDMGQKLFCDADCREDWEYAEGVRRRVGVLSPGVIAGSSGPLTALMAMAAAD